MTRKYTVQVQADEHTIYQVPDVFADSWMEALWVAYGRVLRDDMARQSSYPTPFNRWSTP